MLASLLLTLTLACAPDPGAQADTGPAATRTCNGSAALCERPLDEVALAMTHNAMANSRAAAAGPTSLTSINFPYQERMAEKTSIPPVPPQFRSSFSAPSSRIP